MDAAALAKLRECKGAWGEAAWNALDAATRNEKWALCRAGGDGWRPPLDKKADEEDDLADLFTRVGVSSALSAAAPSRDEERADDTSGGLDEKKQQPVDAVALAKLRECKSAWGEPAWNALDAATRNEKWAQCRAGKAGWRPLEKAEEDEDEDDLADLFSRVGVSSSSSSTAAALDAKKRADDGPAWRSLRPYQRDVVEAVEAAFEDGTTNSGGGGQRAYVSAFVSLPTGGGKTRVAAAVVERMVAAEPTLRVLFVVNRMVLVRQSVEALANYVTATDDLLDGAALEKNKKIVTVAMVQTLQSRKYLEPSSLGNFDVVVLDEAHGAAADTYLKLLKNLLPGARVLGLTATPHRLDRDDVLGSAFGAFVSGPSLTTLIHQGFLATPRVLRPKILVQQQGASSFPEPASPPKKVDDLEALSRDHGV